MSVSPARSSRMTTVAKNARTSSSYRVAAGARQTALDTVPVFIPATAYFEGLVTPTGTLGVRPRLIKFASSWYAPSVPAGSCRHRPSPM